MGCRCAGLARCGGVLGLGGCWRTVRTVRGARPGGGQHICRIYGFVDHVAVGPICVLWACGLVRGGVGAVDAQQHRGYWADRGVIGLFSLAAGLAGRRACGVRFFCPPGGRPLAGRTLPLFVRRRIAGGARRWNRCGWICSAPWRRSLRPPLRQARFAPGPMRWPRPVRLRLRQAPCR